GHGIGRSQSTSRLVTSRRYSAQWAPDYSASPFTVTARCSAASAASWPLDSDESSSPARSSAWASLSTVRIPNPTGLPVSNWTRVSPEVTASATKSKCGVSPRIMTPKHTTASYPLVRAACAASGISNEPATLTSRWVAPEASSVAVAPSMSPCITVVCQEPAMIATWYPVASTANWGAPCLAMMFLFCWDDVIEFGSFGGEVASIFWVPTDYQSNAFGHVDTVGLQLLDLIRVIRQQFDVVDAQGV